MPHIADAINLELSMKRIVFASLALLLLAACAPSMPTLLPVDTVVALTMEALPKTDTPQPIPTDASPPTLEATSTLAAPGMPELPSGASGAACVPSDTERITALVSRVIDGDTIEVAMQNSLYRVRYIGVDTPESTFNIEWYGPQAAAVNKRLVNGQEVLLVKDQSDLDAEGFLLRYVFVGDTFVNYEMLQQGLGISLPEAPDTACQDTFATAEGEARLNVLGVWAPTPIPTATFTATPTITPDVTQTPTLEPACDCEEEGVTCKDFRRQRDAQACFEYCKATGFGDVFGIDKNNNNKACEGMP
jgi:endonuclease YncB( thermonuclease family)